MLLRFARITLTLGLAAMLVAATTITTTPAAYAAEFSDTEGKGYAEAVDALAERDIITGDNEGRFNPEQSLTRGQMATVLTAALELPTAEHHPFADAVGHPHEAGIAALAAADITDGCTADAFCPDEPISRAALATLLVEGFGIAATDAVHFDDGGGVHEDNIHALAEAGVAAGCTAPISGFCPTDDVLRWQAAYFAARALDLIERVELTPLAERQELEAQRQERLAAKRAAAEEEARVMAAQSERDAMWDRLAQCESGGNWSINTGNGYYGGLQFSLSSWRGVGGSGYPHYHSREEQIYRAEILLDRQGWGAWPACSSKLGYR